MGIKNKPKVIERIPYESENQYSAAFYEVEGKTYCTVKGSLEKVIEFSEENKKYNEQNEELTRQGYRVIAIASGKVKEASKEYIKNLEFIGLVAFIDPIRKEVKDSLMECHNAGIKVMMITGDHPLTAYAIAKDLGLCNSKEEVATGKDIIKLLREKSEKGKLVFVGDGINDAPVLAISDIGIAMGSGTDVAKETASMIVRDDNFTSIVAGIKEGRTAYSNIRKITLFLLSCGFAEVCFFLLSIALGYDIPLLAIQLLWLNIVTDGLQDVALSFEKAEDDMMKERPRDTNESLFSKDLMIEVSILGLTISAIVFGTWKYMMDKNINIVLARSVIMMLMVFIQNINVFNCRSEKKSIFKKAIQTNPYVIITVIGSILLQIIIAEYQTTAMFFKITPLPVVVIIKLFTLSLMIIMVYEIYKLCYKIFKKN